MREEIIAGPNPGDIVVNRIVDVEPIRDYCREINARGHAGWSPSREMKLAATVPMNMLHEWARLDGILATFMQMPKKEFFEWVRRKCIQHHCTDFLVRSDESFRVNMNDTKPVPTKRKFIIPD